MTGEPAETWRKFRFHSAPLWSVVFLFLICIGIGFFVSAFLMYVVSRRASGYLPLTQASNRKLALVMRIAIAIVAIAILMGILAVFLASRNDLATSVASLVLTQLAIFVFVCGALGLQTGLQITYPLFGPKARVMKRESGQSDRLVELRNVHPAFATAVLQMQQERSVPPLPLAPGSN
jgi:multisubunit Na+/H+ antiporter MnhC subunit